jgi:hypothetical protein
VADAQEKRAQIPIGGPAIGSPPFVLEFGQPAPRHDDTLPHPQRKKVSAAPPHNFPFEVIHLLSACMLGNEDQADSLPNTGIAKRSRSITLKKSSNRLRDTHDGSLVRHRARNFFQAFLLLEFQTAAMDDLLIARARVWTGKGQLMGFGHSFVTVGGFLAPLGHTGQYLNVKKWFKIKDEHCRGVAQSGSAPALGASLPFQKLHFVFIVSQSFQ